VIDILAVPMCLAAAGLALAMGRAPGRPVRRWLPFAAAAVSVLLLLHALSAVPDWILLALKRRAAPGPLEAFDLFVYEPWFLVGGLLFGVAGLLRCRPPRPEARAGSATRAREKSS